MRQPHFTRFCFTIAAIQLLFCAACSAAPASAADRAERIKVVQSVMQKQEAEFEKHLQNHPQGISTRDLPNAALLVLRAQRPARDAEALLDRVFAAQDMDPASKGYGTVPWKIGDPSVKDANAIEFTMQPMGAIFIRYGGQLSPQFLSRAEPHLRAALVGLNHHGVKITYTNIFVMNTISSMILAQYLHDDTAMTRAKAQWQEWRTYTRQNGIHEFNSPTYYATDLADLTYGQLYVADPAIHLEMEEAESLLWRDIASMYLSGAQRLAGARSRDYQFLSGRGSLEMNLFLEGLYDAPDHNFTEPYLEKVAVLENERPGAFHPSREILDLARLPARVVEQRFDAAEKSTRYTYLTQDFAIGTANGSYGAQDKMFSADLAASPSPVSISVVADASGSPYGVAKTKDKSGHSKPTHLPPGLSSVQKEGTALLIFDLDPQAAASSGESYSTNLILPSHPASLLVDGKVVVPSGSLHQALQSGSVVALRIGRSCFAARVIGVDALDAKAPSLALQADSEGWNLGAIRLAVVHSEGPLAATTQRHLHVSMLVQASTCGGGEGDLNAAAGRLRDAKVSVAAGAGSFTASAEIGDLRLEVTEDLSRRLPVHRMVNGIELSSPVFNLNLLPMMTILANK